LGFSQEISDSRNIDPPYNTGHDFIYPDNFTDPLETYLRLSAQKDENGNLLTSNPETNGRYHSSWLSMMYPRLFLGRQLLANDGAIFVSIDDHEIHDLRMLMNEVFGEENFVACFIWQKRTTRENRKVFSFNHDYVLCFSKNKLAFQASRNLLPLSEEVLGRYSNPDNDPRRDWQSVSLNAQAGPGRRKEQFYSVITPSGRVVDPPPGRCWTLTKDRMDALIADKRVWFGEDGDNVPREKIFLSEARDGLTPHTLWTADEVGTTDTAKKDLIKLFDGAEVYDTPKPLGLLDRIIGITTSPDTADIVLDFFAGSCTTAHSVLAANAKDNGNRRFISIQIPEPTPSDTGARRAGFKDIAAICRQRLRLACREIARAGNGKLDMKDRKEPVDLQGLRIKIVLCGSLSASKRDRVRN
jgi:adenine-specific DNA-methyltransferase